MEIKCVGCQRLPSEIAEYVEASKDWRISADQYVRSQEGTYNRTNGHFYCTNCYCKAGMPLGKAP